MDGGVPGKSELAGGMRRRERCPACLGRGLPPAIPPHAGLRFPLLPLCVGTERGGDFLAPFNITICSQCGLILLLDVADPEMLYRVFHSDGIGKVWDAHYEKFASLIAKHRKGGKLLEIGAGQGKLMEKLLARFGGSLEAVDPVYEGPREGVKVHPCLFDSGFAARNAGAYDAVASSHTLEHFNDFNEYFSGAWRCLKEGGMLFTSVPNQELNFARGYGNQLNFEHPSACTTAHWLHLHYRNGFEVRELSFFSDHSVQIAAQKAGGPISYQTDAKGLSEKLLSQYGTSINARIATVRARATPDRENWLFGASNFSQPLFVYGLDEAVFAGVMDNSPLKHGKRLYGTSLVCRKPEDVVKEGKPLRVFLNVGYYNDEVRQQLSALDPSIELVLL